MDRIDDLPSLSAREAYLAFVEFLHTEFELAGPNKEIHLGGLLAELEPQSNGTSSDPGGVEQFVDAVLKIQSQNYESPWSELRGKNA